MKRLIVTVHGIRTFGNWQERLESLLVAKVGDTNLTIINYKFGYFSVIAFLAPPFRWLVVRRFRRFLMSLVKSNAWDRIDLVGHSFGTHVITWALYDIPAAKRPKIHTLILGGSVLKSSFPWQTLIGHGVERVVNDCGISDSVLILNQITVLFTGMAGRSGFNGGTGRSLRNRYFSFGHSGYFQTDNQPDDSFMRRYWVPLLTSTNDPELVDERKSTALSGIKLALLNNAEPIKVAVYSSPFVIVALIYMNLYQGAEEARRLAEINRQDAVAQRKEADVQRNIAVEQRAIAEKSERRAVEERDHALITQSRFLADLAFQQIRTGDATYGLQLALEALPSSPESLRPLTDEGERALRCGWSVPVWVSDLNGHPPLKASVSGDGKRIVTISTSGKVALWDRSSGKIIANLLAGTGRSDVQVILNPDPRIGQFLTLTPDGSLTLWDDAGQKQTELKEASSATFSPDGRRLMVAQLRQLQLWDLESGRLLRTFKGDVDRLTSLNIVPDGSRIITGAQDGTARVWDPFTGRLLAVMRGHTSPIVRIVIDPAAQLAVTVSSDIGRVWDLQTFGNLGDLTSDKNSIAYMSFNPSGETIIAVMGKGSDTRQWRVTRQPNSKPRFQFEVVPAIEMPLSTLQGACGIVGSDVTTLSQVELGVLQTISKSELDTCLTPAQRKAAFLDPEPPRWCITGVSLDHETDSAQWHGKPPYQTADWKQWLVAKDKGENLPLPGSSVP